MTGIFYGVGVGPGDPELLTLKALRILNEVDVIIAPEAVAGKGSVAADIIHHQINHPNKILPLVFPMTYDREKLDSALQQNVDTLLSLLQQDKNVAFITIGDPMLYSTCAHLMKRLEGHQIITETVPGIPAFCAAASRLNRAIAEEKETVTIIPSAYKQPHFEDLLALSDNVVIMKPSRGFAQMRDQLAKHGFLDNAVMVSRCGQQNEQITANLASIDPEQVEYLSIILAQKKDLS